MGKFIVVVFVALSVVALTSCTFTKVHSSLTATLAKNGASANIVVSFDGTQHVLNGIKSQSFITKANKMNVLTKSLESHAAQTQKNVQVLLTSAGVEFKSYWVNNKIYIKNANVELVEALNDIGEISEIRAEEIMHLINPVSAQPAPSVVTADEWNLVNIAAPDAWAANFTGKGAVVASIDTGVRVTHETLAPNFRSAHGWLDPYDGSEEPNDKVGHGTHTTGVIAGSFQIGVAPEAQWIACKGCNTASCTEDALVACGQWVVCPNKDDCAGSKPQVVSNSWGGGKGNTFYDDVIDAWHVAEIIPVFANGNSGPFCSTANSPGDSIRGVIAVGSTNDENNCSIFSSKGPAVNGLIKPDVCAPGTAIRSAVHTGDAAYLEMSGTSMAAPHVTGVIALMFQANPDLTYDQVVNILQNRSDRNLTRTVRNCGGIDTSKFPNNSYGYGKVNCHEAAKAARDTKA